MEKSKLSFGLIMKVAGRALFYSLLILSVFCLLDVAGKYGLPEKWLVLFLVLAELFWPRRKRRVRSSDGLVILSAKSWFVFFLNWGVWLFLFLKR